MALREGWTDGVWPCGTLRGKTQWSLLESMLKELNNYLEDALAHPQLQDRCNTGRNMEVFQFGPLVERIVQTVVELQRALATQQSKHTFRAERIDQATVVFATLSSSGRSSIRPADLKREWTLLLVDEAAQASEVESLIPFRFRPKRLILVGDPKQLPATTYSLQAEQTHFGRSMM